MIEGRPSGNGKNKNEFYQAVGLEQEEALGLRNLLDNRLVKTINQFPFSSEETSDISIITLVYPRSKDESRISLKGLAFTVGIGNIEKTMDNVIISRSRFFGKYKYGPKTTIIDRTNGHEETRFLYKIVEFPVFVEGERGYLVSKNIDYIEKTNEDGSKDERRISLDYLVSFLDDGLMFDRDNFDSGDEII